MRALPFGARNMAEAAEISRGRMVWASIVLIEARKYTRDSDGKFAAGGGGVRQSLKDATTIDAIAAAAATEARSLTGRDVPFDMTGSDPQIAREHAEGVLKVMEVYPEVGIMRVRTADLAGQDPSGGTPYARVIGDDVVFSREFASDPTGYRDSLKGAEEIGWYAPGHASPTAIGIHEASHLTGPEWETGPRAYPIAVRSAHAAGQGQTTESVDDFVATRLGRYATTGGEEMTAIAVTDTMLHGSRSSQLARDLRDMNDVEYRRVIGEMA